MWDDDPSFRELLVSVAIAGGLVILVAAVARLLA